MCIYFFKPERSSQNRPRVINTLSADQFDKELYRPFVTKLEAYLNSRATFTIDAKKKKRRYTPIDRGIFYNKKLQQARMEIAAELLERLQPLAYKENDGVNQRKELSAAITDAWKKNSICEMNYARPRLDGSGKFRELLTEMKYELPPVTPKFLQNARF